MPVLPEVGSTMVPPGLSLPLFSASSTIPSAMRSLIEPPGLARSDFIQTFCPAPNSRLMRMCGVFPIVARMSSAFMASPDASLAWRLLYLDSQGRLEFFRQHPAHARALEDVMREFLPGKRNRLFLAGALADACNRQRLLVRHRDCGERLAIVPSHHDHAAALCEHLQLVDGKQQQAASLGQRRHVISLCILEAERRQRRVTFIDGHEFAPGLAV